MTRRLTALLTVATFVLFAASATKKKPARRRVTPVQRITPAQRQAARDRIERYRSSTTLKIENPEALEPFYQALRSQQPIHILQFGDSHTASDDWVNSMRTVFRTAFGDGGPGFVQAGSPYKGYRRFDARGQSSLGWHTAGTMALRGDPNQGLSGISVSTESPGQTVALEASGEALSILYLRQPDGGQLELTADDQPMGAFTTSGEPGPGVATYTLLPGLHRLELRTLDRAPVRLFGWTLDDTRGATFETLGINGAQASVILDWDETIWASELAARNPALVILAYGTNEANSRKWTLEQYRADLNAVLARVRHAVPGVAILMVGPPDCGRLKPLLHLDEVVETQRLIAREQHVAFWDWRAHMGGSGSVRLWVTAGYGQTDYIHMTGEGYRLTGEMIAAALLENHDEQARENR